MVCPQNGTAAPKRSRLCTPLGRISSHLTSLAAERVLKKMERFACCVCGPDTPEDISVYVCLPVFLEESSRASSSQGVHSCVLLLLRPYPRVTAVSVYTLVRTYMRGLSDSCLDLFFFVCVFAFTSNRCFYRSASSTT